MRLLIKFILLPAVISLILLLSIKPIMAFYYCELGKQDFQSKNYQQANKNFKQAIDMSPNNLNYRYYYASSLAFVSNLGEAKEEFAKIVKASPDSKIGKLSLVEFNKIKIYLDQKASVIASFARSQDNYINSITNDGKIIHWNLDKLPLKIFINSSNATGEQINTTIKALNVWMNSLDGILKYKMVNDPNNANIVISFSSNTSVYKSKDNGNESSAGITTHHIENDMLRFVTIILATIGPNQKPVSNKELYAVTLHEVGHALGIGAHSYYKADIMYPIVENKSKYEDVRLSHRDINTVKLLYQLDADISNFDPGDINKKQGLNAIILGSSESRYENELREAKNYLNTTPNNPLSWINLGEAYHNLKRYNEALSCYRKALELDKKFTIARDHIARTYIDMNDLNSAISEYSSLAAENPDNIIFSSNLALLYMQTNQKDKAQATINTLISKNPQAQEDQTVKNILAALKDRKIKLKIALN